MAANAAGPQPDFGVLADSVNTAAASFNIVATHLGRCANVPAIAGVQAVLDAILRVEANLVARIDGVEAALGARIDGVEAALGARIDGLGARIDRLETCLVFRDQNSVVRQQNGFVVNTRDSPLEELCSVLTGDPIPGFPRRLSDIDNLTSLQADAILRELGTRVEGGVREKRRRIRALCGVRPVV